MSVDTRFFAYATDFELTGSFVLDPQALYRGMAVSVEYAKLIYVKNVGDADLQSPSMWFLQLDYPGPFGTSYCNRKVTGSAKGSVGVTDEATILLPYYTEPGKYWFTGLTPGVIFAPASLGRAVMAVDEAYNMHTKYRVSPLAAAQACRWAHCIGGSGP